VITVFDPLRLDRGGMLLRRADYALWLLFHSPGRIVEIARRRLGRGDDTAEDNTVGAIAEYHALSGLDDGALVARAGDVEIVAHERYFDARYRLVRLGARALGAPTSLSLVLRAKPAAS
jgi:hypothetical protein